MLMPSEVHLLRNFIRTLESEIEEHSTNVTFWETEAAKERRLMESKAQMRTSLDEIIMREAAGNA